MKIVSAIFFKGILGTDDILYEDKFQVAFMGRSNVGKSSLINSLVGKHDLAKSSSTPGQTTRMNFYLINSSIYFVDFPGYGYAKRSPEKREKLAKMILWYLKYSDVRNRIILLILDAKVGLTAFDKDILNTIYEHHIDHVIVANKIDNVSMSQKDKQLAIIKAEAENSEIIPYSSKEKFRKKDLLNKIESIIEKKAHNKWK